MKRLIVASTVACLLSVLPGLAHRNAQGQVPIAKLTVQESIAAKNAGAMSSNTPAYIWIEKCSPDLDPPQVVQWKSRGTTIDGGGDVKFYNEGVPAPPDGVYGPDCLGKNTFVGSYGASWITACMYRVMVDGTPSSGKIPTRFMIDTMGTLTAPETRMTIKSNGNVGIGSTDPGANKLYVYGNIYATGEISGDSIVDRPCARSTKRNITPVPATGQYSLAPGLARGQRTGAWDLLDGLNVVDFEYKKCEKRWLMPGGRIVNSYDEATSTVTRVGGGRTVQEVLQPDELGATEYVEWVDEGSGNVHRGFIAEDVPDEFTTDHKSVIISDVVANNTAALKEAKRRILELETIRAGFDTRLAAVESARADLAKEVQQLATGVIRVEDLKPGAENKAVVMQLTESVLRQLGVDPWVEIALADAVETVPETNSVTSVKTVTKYRLNIASRQIEPYTVEESVTDQVPTGRTIERLKAGVRFDEITGKLYRWVGLASADAAEKLAALRTASQIASLPVSNPGNAKLAAR